eukprot:scaffold1523_cov162-Skeletonema_menzelii.AAC.1
MAIVESRIHQRNVRCTSSERWIKSLGWTEEGTVVIMVIVVLRANGGDRLFGFGEGGFGVRKFE